MTTPVFVLGVGRCGSTLVHELLARHDGTGFVTNLDDLGLLTSSAGHNRLWRRLPPSVTEKGRARFAPSEAYRALGREVGPLLVDPIRDLTAADATPWVRERLTRFVERRTSRLAAPVFLHKFTGWPRVGMLAEVFPDARFIHIVRDGRAVANSWVQMPWWRGHRGPDHWHFGPLPEPMAAYWEEHDRSFPVLAALGWQLLMERFETAREAVGDDRWLEVRYEDVVDRPEANLRSMLEHMGLPWTSSYAAAVGRYTFDTSRTQAFRRDLGPADVAAMTEAMSTQLKRSGYATD